MSTAHSCGSSMTFPGLTSFVDVAMSMQGLQSETDLNPDLDHKCHGESSFGLHLAFQADAVHKSCGEHSGGAVRVDQGHDVWAVDSA